MILMNGMFNIFLAICVSIMVVAGYVVEKRAVKALKQDAIGMADLLHAGNKDIWHLENKVYIDFEKDRVIECRPEGLYVDSIMICSWREIVNMGFIAVEPRMFYLQVYRIASNRIEKKDIFIEFLNKADRENFRDEEFIPVCNAWIEAFAVADKDAHEKWLEEVEEVCQAD